MSMTMGKEASLDGLEFDGDTVLCRVCGDKASGFHYGVHACEGCKGFFRRSIQQKIQYRPCLKNQQCNIMRVNRNRCQYCRLKKCIAVGMSRDAVRFGRVPKKEKARIIEQMQKSNLQMASTVMSSVMTGQDLVQAVVLAHRQTSDLGQEKVKLMREIALLQSDYVDCPAHMACPLNSHAGQDSTDNQEITDFSEFYVPAIRSVVDFAKLIPGFLLLNQDDQITLLKAATFEVLLVRMASLFDTDSSTMMFANGKLFRRQTSGLTTSVGFLLDSMFDFAERFNKLGLSDDEIALFSAVVLLSPDRPGIRQIEPVEKFQNKLTESLQNMINMTHKEDSTLFAKLLMKTTDLRTLNALHAEKEVAAEKAEENVEMQESQAEDRSERSSPSDTSSSNTFYASSSSMDMSSIYDSNGSIGQVPSHSQMVLKTPYGMFYREDNTGYYGMVNDQPRRRCHTLDRDSQISRPRLQTIEEAGRRRYTMDREYISKMVGKLSDRLEKRAMVNSMPGSVNNSAASSPVPIMEEQYAMIAANRDFIPISAPDSNPSSTRTSPSFHKDLLQPFSSSPNSPRPRSDSMGTDDFGPQMRPRCSSFHLNSEGHAGQSRLYPTNTDADFLTSPEGQHFLMSAEMRRGSVGASHNLHAKKKSLLVDRHAGYLSQGPDSMFRKFDKQRSPLASESPSKVLHMGSGGSAFEQVPRLNIPTTSSWGTSQHEPPKVSVTAPNEEQHTIVDPTGQPAEPAAAGPSYDTALSKSPVGSSRNSPDMEIKNEDMYHKKFDKLRKHMVQSETRQMEKLSIQDPEMMESEMNVDTDMNSDGGHAPREGVIAMPTPVKPAERNRKTAGEAHPQLLAQLTSGPQFNAIIKPKFPISSAPSSSSSAAASQQQMLQQQQQQQHQLQQVKLNFPPNSHLSRSDQESVGQMTSGGVLNVPKNMFAKVHPSAEASATNSYAGSYRNGSTSSIAGNHHHLESMLRSNTSPRNSIRDQQYLAGCPTLNPSSQHLHLKEQLAGKFNGMEMSVKYENDNEERAQNQNGNVAGDVRSYPSNGQHLLHQAYQMRPGFESQMAMAQQMAMYAPMLGHQSNMAAPQFNQHLAGMQQMVYGSKQQQARREGNDDVPLNLAQSQAEQQQQQLQYPIKIKEEVIS